MDAGKHGKSKASVISQLAGFKDLDLNAVELKEEAQDIYDADRWLEIKKSGNNIPND